MSVGNAVKSAFRRAGVEVGHYRPPERRRAALIEASGVRTVIDVGANVGQYGTELRRSGFRGHIVSFEPLARAFAVLEASTAGDPQWSCRHVAVSDTSGPGTLQVARNTESSSLLAMSAVHERAAPHARVVGSEEVAIRRLDAPDNDLESLPGPWMLKLDVQGHEKEALSGAEGVLDRIVLAEVELSVHELYLGAPRILEMMNEMDRCGFDLVALEPGFYDPCDGTMLQFDGMFRRRD